MADQPTMEERLALLEIQVAELQSQRRAQEDRDVALLARIDTFIDDLHRVERVQLRSSEELRAGQSDLREEFRAHQEYMTDRFNGVETRLDNMDTRFNGVETRLDQMDTRFDGVETRLDNIDTRFDGVETRLDNVETDMSVLIESAKDHKRAIETLLAGQQQIIGLISGKQTRND
jgi:chromosome segregation ATPase